MADETPNPGSPAAIASGCRCPRMDNANGAGVMGLGREWWINEDCPMHARTPDTMEVADG